MLSLSMRRPLHSLYWASRWKLGLKKKKKESEPCDLSPNSQYVLYLGDIPSSSQRWASWHRAGYCFFMFFFFFKHVFEMYFIYHEIHLFPKCSSVVFRAFAELRFQHRSLVLEHDGPPLTQYPSPAGPCPPLPRLDPNDPWPHILPPCVAPCHRNTIIGQPCGVLWLAPPAQPVFEICPQVNISMRTPPIFPQANSISLDGYATAVFPPFGW